MIDKEKNNLVEDSKNSDQDIDDKKKWSHYVDDYNNYVEEYNKYFVKSKNGDKRSLSLYPYMKQKWGKLKKILTKACSNKKLSDRQIKSIEKIDLKILK